MDWLTLSLTAAALWGGFNVVDKVIIEKHIPSPWLCACFMATYGLVSALVVGLMVPIRVESLGSTALTCLSGLLYLVYILLYFAALGHGDSVVVAALGQITPIFAALWDYLILGQVFGMMTYLGVGVIVVAPKLKK